MTTREWLDENNAKTDGKELRTQHTPGPWHQMNDAQHECRVIQDNNGQRIAETDFGFNDNGLANARLIAAAPDLLAACKAMAIVGTWGKSSPILAQANAAIRRAIRL